MGFKNGKSYLKSATSEFKGTLASILSSFSHLPTLPAARFYRSDKWLECLLVNIYYPLSTISTLSYDCSVNYQTYSNIQMMKLTTVKASSLLTVMCLSAALTITSCGKKDKVETTEPIAKPEAAAPATGASTAPAAMAGAALSLADKAKLTPVKTALVMANSAVKSGDMTKAKSQFDKFSGLWTTVEPMLKSKAGASYPAISSGIEMVKTAMSGATPDKAKAGEGLTSAIKAITAVMDKK